MRLIVTLTSPNLGVAFSPPVAKEYIEADPYTGDYEVTPSSEQQTLQTKNLRMTRNLVVNPIPSNYGLITWNGSTLTVS